ncbi:D(1) dopamine receptor-like [Watersipora subatra]|uniref:D(1) dopamine receptor-like n=1 Tax=Watersipora subatra TaxID=2589382 RepID=UPI00355C062B
MQLLSGMRGLNMTLTTTEYVWTFKDISLEDIRGPLTIGLLSVVFFLIMLATIFGNIIVIIAILTYRQLKKQQSNLFILNLAFADISVAVTVMIWSTVAFILNMGKDNDHPWIFSTGMCYFQCAMNYCLIVVSMMTLGFISVDRFVHIVYPLRYLEILTIRRIRIMIAWTWIQGLIIGFIPVGMQWIHYDYCEIVCAIDWSSKHADKFVIAAFITCFIVPASTMLVCYTVIFKKSMAYTAEIKKSMELSNDQKKSSQSYDSTRSLKKNSKKNPIYGVEDSRKTSSKDRLTTPNSDNKPSLMRRHNATVKESTIIKSLLIVVLVFFICMTPFCVTKLIKVLKGYIPCWVNTFATIVQLLASACNPLIYGIFRKEYRKAFKIQYNKACHRMQARFTSSELSESGSSPYCIDNKLSTLKRKELTRKVNMSNVELSDIAMNSREDPTGGKGKMNGSALTNIGPHSVAEGEEMLWNTETTFQQPFNSGDGEGKTNYSLPARYVSFRAMPELVNQTTEIIAL